MRVLVAIPCLNEDVAIASVVVKARQHASDVLVVDDGSTDQTSKVAKLAGARVVRHEKNKGKGGAYQTLWAIARDEGYDCLVVLDGDGQHDADEIPLLVAKMKEGADFVIGARWGEKTQMPLWRKAGKRVLDYATALGTASKEGAPRLTDSQSGFRAYSRRALETLAPAQAGFSVESQLIMDAHGRGLRFAEVPINCRYDVDGSTQGPVRHASNVLNDILVQVGIQHPLVFIGLPGILALLLGVVAGGWTTYVYEREQALAIGWALVTVMLVIVGVLAIFISLIFNILPRMVRRTAGP